MSLLQIMLHSPLKLLLAVGRGSKKRMPRTSGKRPIVVNELVSIVRLLVLFS